VIFVAFSFRNKEFFSFFVNGTLRRVCNDRKIESLLPGDDSLIKLVKLSNIKDN
jgi:hypothetical protein